MITAIVTVRALPGKGPALEADFAAYAEKVRANEPGAVLYSLNRSREDPDLYYAIEIYQDEAALQTHLENFQKAGGGTPGLFAGPPEILTLTRVV